VKDTTVKATVASAKPSRGWRVWISWFLVLLFAAEVCAAIFIKRKDKTFAVSEFARLPLVFNGRVQPMDSLARNSLLQIRGMTSVPLEGNGPNGAWGTWEELRVAEGSLHERRWHQFSKHPKKLKPAEWLLEVLCDARRADDRYVFVVNHPDLRSQLKLEGGVEKSGLHFFRFNDLKPRLEQLQNEANRVETIDNSHRNAFDRAVLQLYNAFGLYLRLKNTLQPEDTRDFRKEIGEYTAAITEARAKAQALQAKGEQIGRETLDELLAPVQKYSQRYSAMARLSSPLVVPLRTNDVNHETWRGMGPTLLEITTDNVPEPVKLLAGLSSAYQAGNADEFNSTLTKYQAFLAAEGLTREVKKASSETFFNRLLAFKRSMYFYIAAFLLVLLYWAGLRDIWRVTALRLVLLGLLVHTAGLIFRMWLEGRPPVTNLYSSAIFIGWGAVVLGLVLEKFFKDGIGLIVAASIGFLTLIVAHNLSLGGDTMEMMRAVLDTNFWLATHVVVVTLGYASTFVGGFLALIYILRGVFTRTLTGNTAKSLARMVYGIVCFATLFSFVGTVLGGIWADQSWGRFWGWDPKENGALIIVLWNALILHARWGGMVRERGLMLLAIAGNIVTAWSWFGVNMLGIGLHAYGFMDAAFKWLMLFVISQLALVGIGLIPLSSWRSFKFARPGGETNATAAA
jgi:ABC-type transport system involved in cytochrome c biogenesis permease subunit